MPNVIWTPSLRSWQGLAVDDYLRYSNCVEMSQLRGHLIDFELDQLQRLPTNVVKQSCLRVFFFSNLIFEVHNKNRRRR